LGVITTAAIVGTVFTTYSLFLSYDYISIGLASTLHFIYPAITCILAIIIYKENFSRNKILALIFSLIGIVFLTLNKDVQLNVKGIFWALISGLFYAIYIICAANKELKKLSPYTVAFYVFGITGILFFIWGLKTNSINYDLSYKALLYLGNLSFLSTFVAVILFFVGMQGIGPSNAAILSTFEPITGVLLGLMIFNEQLNINMLMGSVLVLVSVFLISKEKTVGV
jgi:drug/metabolite transporter (DMT)-like permease